MDASQRLKELKKTWKAPAELERCRPREVRLKVAGRAMFGLSWILFAASIFAPIMLYVKASSDLEKRQHLRTTGLPAPARVARRWISSGDDKKYYIEYDYWANGRTYAGRVNVGKRGWGAFPPGSAVPVIFLPGNPQVHLVRGFAGSLMPLWLPFGIGPVFALGGWLVLHVLNKERTLLAEGRAAPGVVIRVEKSHQHGKGAHYQVAHYAFLQLSGAMAMGKSGAEKKQPAEGSTICVIYEPDRVRNNAVYPLSLVRAVRAPVSGSDTILISRRWGSLRRS